MTSTLAAVLLASVAAPLSAQEATLDLLDGETLYDGGFLVTLAYERQQFEDLLDGGDEIDDPLDQRRVEEGYVASIHWGVRHDLQLSAILPTVRRAYEADGVPDLEGSGVGDAAFVAKWRFYRWDAPHKALNVALIGGIELPTGADDEEDGGATLPPELQPGSGSWDPLAGIGATYEPGRWRFNAVALYKHNTENGDDYRFGDELQAEFEVGNRFWLEPYPGPFMRADLRLRYTSEGRAELDGDSVADTGFDLWTAGANLAFRPRPSLDFQLGFDVPIDERVEGVQLAHDWALTFTVGYRF